MHSFFSVIPAVRVGETWAAAAVVARKAAGFIAVRWHTPLRAANLLVSPRVPSPSCPFPQACRPLHLLADVSFSSGNRIGLTAYGAHPSSAQRRTVFAFQRLKLAMVAGPEERVAIDTFAKAVAGACQHSSGGRARWQATLV